MANTVNEMLPAKGAIVQVTFESIHFAMRVVDVKNTWGKVRLLVEPLPGQGFGTQWVEMTRVKGVIAESASEFTLNTYAISGGSR